MSYKLSKRERLVLLIFMLFVTAFELLHIVIDTNPPMLLRMFYTAVYVGFAIISPRLVPTFTAINLVMERFSSVFGEFLPNTLLFHISILLYGIILIRNINPLVHRKDYAVRQFYTFLLLYIYAIVSVFLHVDISPDFSFVINGAFLMLFVYFVSLLDDRYLKSIIVYSVYAMAIVCTIGLLNYNNLVEDYETSLGTVDRMEWKDANYFSFCIAIFIMITCYIIARAKNKTYRRVMYLICLIMAICMLSLLSRGSVVALLIALIYYFRKNILSFRSLGTLAVIASVVALFYFSGMLEGMILRFMSDDLATGSGRTEIWSIGMHTFLEKGNWTILFGAGEGQALKMAYFKGAYWSPHNNYLEILYNYGIVGLSLFCAWIAIFFKSARSKEVRALILLIAVNSFTIVPFPYVTPLWFIVGLLMVLDRRSINDMLYEQ